MYAYSVVCGMLKLKSKTVNESLVYCRFVFADVVEVNVQPRRLCNAVGPVPYISVIFFVM